MKRSTLQTHIISVVSFLFIVLFVYAATSKLLDFENFRIQLGQSPILTAYADWVAWAVPLLEYLIAALLIFAKYRLWGLYAFYTLMVMFTTYIILVLNFSDYIPCSCGGVLEDLGWTEHIVFNLVFIVMAFFGVIGIENQPEFNKE